MTTKNYLIVDTETAGLPRNWKAPVSDINNWPRMIQLAWGLYNEHGVLIENKCYIIRPNGFTIPESATAVHGISTQQALLEGVELTKVLTEFIDRLNLADLIVAHNIDFDSKIIGAELFRMNANSKFGSMRQSCTMKASTDFCKIPGNYGFKWPTLSELHQTLFSTDFDGAHDAMNDVNACARCFFALKEKGLILA